MTVRNIVKMINPQNIPIHFHNNIDRDQLFSTRLLTADELRQLRDTVREDLEIGIYFPDFTVNEVYDQLASKSMVSLRSVEERIRLSYQLSENQDIKYITILFMVLHEFGHWEHFKRSGLSGIQYYEVYGRPEAILYYERFCCASHCDPADWARIEEEFAHAYRQLPIEAEADAYALRRMIEFM